MRKLIGMVLGMAAAVAQAQQLTLVTEEYPPYNMSSKGGGVTGISTDIVRELMAATGFEFTMSVLPWARAITMARTQPHTCVFSMSRTPEREPHYKWVGPLVFNDWALFAKKPAPRPASLDAVKKARIGSYEGDAIVDYLQARHYAVDVGINDAVNPRKLLAGHIDYWATGKLIGQYRLRQQQIDNIEPVLTFNRTEMHLACQKDMADDTIARLNRELAAMQKRGAVDKIYERYGYTP